jgi:hypothetical protein
VRAALPQRKVASLIFPNRSFSNPHHYLMDQRQYAADLPAVHRDIVQCRDRPAQGTAQMPSCLRALQPARSLHFGDTEACR